MAGFTSLSRVSNEWLQTLPYAPPTAPSKES